MSALLQYGSSFHPFSFTHSWENDIIGQKVEPADVLYRKVKRAIGRKCRKISVRSIMTFQLVSCDREMPSAAPSLVTVLLLSLSLSEVIDYANPPGKPEHISSLPRQALFPIDSGIWVERGNSWLPSFADSARPDRDRDAGL